MKRRHDFKHFFWLKLCLSIVLLTSINTIAQQNSIKYLSIRDATTIAIKTKEFKIDSLLNVLENEAKFIQLSNDLYDYAKWQYKNGTLEKAIEISKRCVQIIENLENFDEKIHKKVVNNLGFFYRKKRDYFNAYLIFKKLSGIGKIDSDTSDAYRLAGRSLQQLGDFYEAADYYERSLTVAKQIKNSQSFIISSIDASINYKEIGDFSSLDRGIEILNEAIKLANRTNDGLSVENRISRDNYFSLYNHLGNLYNDRIDFDFVKSKENYDKSLNLALAMKDPHLLTIVYNDLGFLYLHENKKEALHYLNKALKHQPDIETASIIYGNKSSYFLKLNNKEKALFNTQQSINVLTPVLINNFGNLPTKEAVSRSLYKYELLKGLMEKARIWLAFYDVNSTNSNDLFNALRTLKLADYLVDIIRFESNEQQSKLFWRKTASEIYSNAVKVCFYLNKPEEGFYFMEKNKGLLLLEDLSVRKQKEQLNLPDVINKRQLYLKTEILNCKVQLGNDSKQKDSTRLLLLKAKERYSNFIDSLETKYKLYFKKQKQDKVLSLNEVTALTDKNEVYVEYILGENDGFGMLISKTDIKFFKIKEYNKLLNLANEFRRILENPLETKKDNQVYHSVALSIYSRLFPESILEGLTNKKLIIIPDSYLQNMPFEALQTSKEPDSYFIKQNEINYAYSISFLHQNKKWKRENKNDFLGFAPINFSNGMSKLPLSKEEIMIGASLFLSDTFLYNKATKQNFIQNAENHTIIHIASHSNTTDIKNPWIVFDDEKLSLDELYLTKNTANLVVLSACKTSLGSLNEGEGVMSLARGFFNTGANSVMSTLWNTNDKSSSKILTEFYRQVKKGKTKSNALRIAKLNYINNHQLSEQSPYYWSSFVLIGDSGIIPLENNNTLFITLIFSAIFLILIYVLYKKLKY